MAILGGVPRSKQPTQGLVIWFVAGSLTSTYHWSYEAISIALSIEDDHQDTQKLGSEAISIALSIDQDIQY